VAAPVTVGGIALPSGDTLTLDASDDGPLLVDRVGPIWQVLDDLKGLLPAILRKGDSALRDAWLQTWGQATLIAQARMGQVFEAQHTPRFAEDLWLDAWGDLLGRPRAPDELDAAYRTRLMTTPDLVSATAIKAAVNAVFASANIVTAPIYNEPAVDQAFCGPATTSDPVIVNSRQQTIGALQTWFAFTQPLIPINGVGGINQTIYYAQNLRFWANYSGITGNSNIGAFSAPLGAGFWIIAQTPIGDDGLTPHSEPSTFSTSAGNTTVGLDVSDFAQGITGLTTPSQTIISGTPSFTTLSYGYIPAAYDTVIDRLNIEVSRRKAAGVPWVAIIDYPPAYAK
jgi:hypothetical protein